MKEIYNNTVVTAVLTTAESATTSSVVRFTEPPAMVAITAAFLYGSGGTDVTVWAQSNVDKNEAATSWGDVAAFNFTTTTAAKVQKLTIDTPILTPVTMATETLADDTAINLPGGAMRFVYTSTGTYAGGTVLALSLYAVG